MTESQYQTLKAYCLRHRTDHPYLGPGQYQGTPYEEGVLSFVSRLSDLHRQGVTEAGEALVRFRRNKERYNPYSGRRKDRFLEGVDFCLKKARSVLGAELTDAELTDAEKKVRNRRFLSWDIRNMPYGRKTLTNSMKSYSRTGS